MHHHSTQILAHTNRTPWRNKIHTLHPSYQQNSSQHAMTLELYLKQLPQNIKRWMVFAKPTGRKPTITQTFSWILHDLAASLSIMHMLMPSTVNSCPAKNVTDQDGNLTRTLFQYSYGRKPSLANFHIFACPVYFKHYEPTFCNKLITYKQQLQPASRGIFIGFPVNSASWLAYSPEHPQRIVITCNAYFDKDISSALAFDSKPFARAIPIESHLDPNWLQTSDNSKPSIVPQIGSAANLSNSASIQG